MTTEPTTPISPVVVSQETCHQAYGVSSSWYLRHAHRGCFRTWRVGKLVLSLPADFVGYLQSLPVAARNATADPTDILAEIGARRAG